MTRMRMERSIGSESTAHPAHLATPTFLVRDDDVCRGDERCGTRYVRVVVKSVRRATLASVEPELDTVDLASGR